MPTKVPSSALLAEHGQSGSLISLFNRHRGPREGRKLTGMNALRSFSARADIETILAQLGAERLDVPVLQPADPFLDTAGEELRRRIFLSESETGETLCLRPEFTIPVCLHHIGAGETGHAATAMSARCSGSAAPAATSSCRPASRISATRTAPPPTRARSPMRWPS
jgi:hypothetical protein